jgi:hypothetical protein
MDGALAMNEVILMRHPWCLVFIFVMVWNQYSALGDDMNLHVQIEEIRRSASTSNLVDRGHIERQLLSLLSDDSSSENRGTVYAAIANTYCGDMVNHYEKVDHYAREALKNQLSIVDACDMYLCLGNAAEARARRSGVTPNVEGLENQAEPFIQGLAFVLEHLRIDRSLSPPSVGKYDVDPRDPQYQEIARQHEKQLAYRNDVLQQNRLLAFRNEFSRRVLQLYPQSQVHAAAFGRIVRDAVGNADKAEKVLRHLRGATDKQGDSR